MQVFWAAVGLLHTSSVPMYACALQLLAAVLRGLKLHQAKVGGRGAAVRQAAR